MLNRPPVRNWSQFDRHIRYSDTRLLGQLDRFPDAILVAGCQRSGTTVVTRILREAIAMQCPAVTRDDELDAALVLSGAAPFATGSRCCFQTTYLNGHFREYFEHHDYRLIWIIRNPYAVVRSMLGHWRRGALNRLFRACGQHALDDRGKIRFSYLGTYGFSRIEKACLSYKVKTSQVHEIAARLGPGRLCIVDYDDLMDRSARLLPDLFSFAEVPYDDRFPHRLRKTDGPGTTQLSETLQKRIRETCAHEYQQAVQLAKILTPGPRTGGIVDG